MYLVPSVEVGGKEVCTKDLFGFQDSLKEMEEQVVAVKAKVEQINSVGIKSEDLERRVKRLIRLEQQHRKRIEKIYKTSSNRVSSRGLLHHAIQFFHAFAAENLPSMPALAIKEFFNIFTLCKIC